MSINVEGVPVRAKFEFANGSIVISTPFIQSFNVKKSRGNPSTFDASLKIKSSEASLLSNPGNNIVIRAGKKDDLKTIFTGLILQAKVSPCWDDPNFIILSISGSDILNLLRGKKYTRRQRAVKATFATINGVTRKGLKSGKFSFEDGRGFIMTDGGTLDQDYHVKTINIDNNQADNKKEMSTDDGVQGGPELDIVPKNNGDKGS